MTTRDDNGRELVLNESRILAHIASLEQELEKWRAALRLFDDAKLSSLQPERQPPAESAAGAAGSGAEISIRAVPLSQRAAIFNLLAEAGEAGMTVKEIVTVLKQRYGIDADRHSVGSQLSKLARAERLLHEGNRWFSLPGASTK
jgi:hypothetical protein